MNGFENILKGNDLRSIGQSNKVVSLINNQQVFNQLFTQLFHTDRNILMRTADAIEKVTAIHPEYLQLHKNDILKLCAVAKNKELKWHLAILITRLQLSKKEMESVCQLLHSWATDQKESKIVRVNAVQGLFNLLKQQKNLKQNFHLMVSEIEKENIPSLKARIKKLKKLDL